MVSRLALVVYLSEGGQHDHPHCFVRPTIASARAANLHNLAHVDSTASHHHPR
jgi:hypothetical protein